jgi:hypothetical protein
VYLNLPLLDEKFIHNGLRKNRSFLQPSRACDEDALGIGDAGTGDLLQVCLSLSVSRQNGPEELASSLTRLPCLPALEVFISRTPGNPKKQHDSRGNILLLFSHLPEIALQMVDRHVGHRNGYLFCTCPLGKPSSTTALTLLSGSAHQKLLSRSSIPMGDSTVMDEYEGRPTTRCSEVNL